MPLDAGAASENREIAETDRRYSAMRPASVVLSEDGHIGAALKAAREQLGLEVEDIAQATRVRAAHVASLEAFDLAALPARPFVIGYVRAYARALGLETEAVVGRFRRDAPDADDDLRAPSGLRGPVGGHRFRWVMVLAAVLIVAVVTWNIVRHVSATPHRPAVTARRAVSIRPESGPAVLGAPLPTPPEAAAPPAYETPGLETTPQPSISDPAGVAFVPDGQVYGATGPGARVILQARKPTSLVVRGPDGAVYFARELAAGEAWRSPEAGGLVADVGNPASIEYYVDGLSRGDLSQSKTPISSLEAAPSTR